MIGRLATLILLSTLSLMQTAEVPRPISLTVVEVGDNVTFQCPLSERTDRLFNWYKQSLGHMAQLVAAGVYGNINLVGQFTNQRFRVQKGNDQCNLTVSDANKEDEAMYFCQTGTELSQIFHIGFFLAVNDNNQQKCVKVKQSPKTASVHPGESVTLQCSLFSKVQQTRVQCPGEHSVYWFRAGSGKSHPGVIYRNSSNERSCVYSLSKAIRNSSDAGTYYCAVVTCGEILFGDGTKVETRPTLDPVGVVLGSLLACCVTVLVILLFFLNQKRVCEHCKEPMIAPHQAGHDRSTADQSSDLDREEEPENYAALTFSTRSTKRGEKRESLHDSVYSAVREEQSNQQHTFR